MYRKSWDVKEFIGQYAQVRLVDKRSGGWGHKGLKLFDMFVVTCRLSEMRQATVTRQCTVKAGT